MSDDRDAAAERARYVYRIVRQGQWIVSKPYRRGIANIPSSEERGGRPKRL